MTELKDTRQLLVNLFVPLPNSRIDNGSAYVPQVSLTACKSHIKMRFERLETNYDDMRMDIIVLFVGAKPVIKLC